MQTSQIYRKERSGDKVESPFRNDNLLVKDAQFYGSNSDYRTINTSNIKVNFFSDFFFAFSFSLTKISKSSNSLML